MKKRVIATVSIFLIIVVIAVTTGYPKDIYFNIVDKGLWNELSDRIEKDKIVEVSIGSVELDDRDKNQIINHLRNSKFYKSNWRGEGPTGTVLSIVLQDGHTQNFEYWGGDFETTYKGGQFVIRSKKLKEIFYKYNLSD